MFSADPLLVDCNGSHAVFLGIVSSRRQFEVLEVTLLLVLPQCDFM